VSSVTIPNARLHLFDDGHLGLLTSADTLAPLVDDFLSVAVTHRPAPA
jgi:hypothetical protein